MAAMHHPNTRRAVGFRPLVRAWHLLLLVVVGSGGCVPWLPGPEGTTVEPDARARIVLLGTTDVHGTLYPYDYYTGGETGYGLARVAPLVDSIRTANPGRTLLFDSGDLLQGNPLAYYYARDGAPRPNPVIRAMNLLEYDAAAIGNHEFNYGLTRLAEAIEDADFPFLSGNVFHAGGEDRAYTPGALLERVVDEDTIRIGVTAGTPPGVRLWDRDHVQGVLEFRDVVESLRPVVDSLRSAGADVVVVLSHGGLDGSTYGGDVPPENAAAALARQVPGIDVIFMGHTHREVADTTINGVLLLQARDRARSLAVATLSLERPAGAWQVAGARGRVLRPDPAAADTAFMDSLRWEHERAVAHVGSVLGRSGTRMEAREARVRDTPVLDFVNEVQRQAAGTDLSSTAAFNLDAAIPAGPVRVADVAALYPYDNTLKAVRITGAQLRAYLEKSAEYYRTWDGTGPVTGNAPGYTFDVVAGVDYTIDLRQPVGARITELDYRGHPVRDEQTFTLALNNYRQGGGGGYDMLAHAPVVYDRQNEIRELLIEEVRRRGTVRPDDYFRENWRIVPEAAAAPALAERAPGPAPQQRPVRRLRVLSTNDFHGHLEPEAHHGSEGRLVGGSAALEAFFEAEERGFAGPTLLVDAGDVMQGTPISGLVQGRSAVAVYNAMGYHVAAVGNHEFDWGVDVLEERVEQAAFPWLSANIALAGADTAPSWIRPTALIEVDGVRVGVIGVTTEDTPYETRPSNVRHLTFSSMADAIDRWVPVLRDSADFVVVVAHEGAECDAAGQACEGALLDVARALHHKPDLIVGGHTHRLVRTTVNGIPVVEAGSRGTRYAVVDLTRTADGVHAWIRGLPDTFVDPVEPDSVIAALVDEFAASIEPLVRRTITTLHRPLDRTGHEYALGRLIADAQRWITEGQVALMNNGGIRTELDTAVTWGDLSRLQPFGNSLVRLELTGAQLRAALEHTVAGDRPIAHVSGLTVWYDTSREPGNRVLTARLDTGDPLRDDSLYAVTVNDFMAEGGDGFEVLTEALVSEDTGILDLDALVEYLQHLPAPVEAPGETRLRMTGEPPSSW